MFCINVMNIIAPLKAQYTPYLRSNFSVNKPNEIKSNSNINFNGLFSKKDVSDPICPEYLLKEYSIKRDLAIAKFSSTLGRVTSEQIEELEKAFPDTIQKISDEVDIKTYSKPEAIGKAAIILKQALEAETKNNTIISIGTSPAAIANVMELMGSEVIYMPASHFNDEFVTYKSPISYPTRYFNTRTVADYLKDKGIFKGVSTKNIVLIDYAASGQTLRNTKEMLTRMNKVAPERIETCSILKTLSKQNQKNIKEKVKPTLNEEEFAKLEFDMAFSMIERISPVPHFNFLKENEEIISKPTEEVFEKTHCPNERFFITAAYNAARQFGEKK